LAYESWWEECGLDDDGLTFVDGDPLWLVTPGDPLSRIASGQHSQGIIGAKATGQSLQILGTSIGYLKQKIVSVNPTTRKDSRLFLIVCSWPNVATPSQELHRPI
jgi:hypothetical protein